MRRLASQNGWRTIIVVTFQPHISRARFILDQCFDGDLVMVASPAQLSVPKWAFQYAYQTAGYVRAVSQPGCRATNAGRSIQYHSSQPAKTPESALRNTRSLSQRVMKVRAIVPGKRESSACE